MTLFAYERRDEMKVSLLLPRFATVLQLIDTQCYILTKV